MTQRSRPVRLVLILLVVVVLRSAPGGQTTAEPPCGIRTSERIVAVADVHGAFDRLAALLREAQLIDARQRWTGGRAVFVQLGDVLDRGPDSRKVLDLLRRLEGEAARAGGRVVALLGNHEVMRMMRDLRYVSAKEYEAFRSPAAHEVREQFYEAAVEAARERARRDRESFGEAAFRKLFQQQIPLGYVEMQAAFEPAGDYGGWLRRHDVVATINDVAFVHGGFTAEVAAAGCRSINATARAEIAAAMPPDDPRIPGSLTVGSNGPLWYRGLADDEGALTPADVDGVLQALGARTIVIGHTPEPEGRVRARFGNRVVQVDTGMLGGEIYPNGRPAALEIVNGAYTAIYMGRREVLFTK